MKAPNPTAVIASALAISAPSSRKRFVFHRGMGHLPAEAAPHVRRRSYRIEAAMQIDASSEGVLIARGDTTSGYSLYLKDGLWCTTSTPAGISARASAPGMRYQVADNAGAHRSSTAAGAKLFIVD